jgi:hypothetical protein
VGPAARDVNRFNLKICPHSASSANIRYVNRYMFLGYVSLCIITIITSVAEAGYFRMQMLVDADVQDVRLKFVREGNCK